jgi:hypothetical protein
LVSLAAYEVSSPAARREVIREFQAAGNDAPTGGPERFAISVVDRHEVAFAGGISASQPACRLGWLQEPVERQGRVMCW